jgi:two-component sensor histidine kinase
LHDASGALIGAVNMLVDISHRKEAETTQRLLYSELNHRIKNNVQTLHGLLNAARRETENPEAQDVLAEAIQRVGAIAAAQKVLYHDNDAVHFGAEEFVRSICTTANQLFGRTVEIDCDATDGLLPNDVAVPLALILNELITNAAKYGANARGEVRVRVRLTREQNEYALLVEDDGSGFEPAREGRRSSGLGLVRGLANQIGGALEIERAGGARCTIRFPVRGHG